MNRIHLTNPTRQSNTEIKQVIAEVPSKQNKSGYIESSDEPYSSNKSYKSKHLPR
ncbi:hypothetical protein LOK49_LG11G00998 [Camellia lanceoleosa]|uniref:Uncharacterized protein n=1 Tax=Camellia lanceoleosa TaxID=1840588 RepID=A0ACC0G7Z7_9ERIC|nr:hypothetical protein LOK49_LG11G00998 [Camellia lanceoleosa]